MKSGLSLIIETPRAGNLGHRTLASQGLETAEVVSLVDRIRASRIGPNYIAASREVQQNSEYGGIRMGTETIGLVGVDVGRLPNRDISRISNQLTLCLDMLDGLVLQEVNWQAFGENEVVVKCQVLDDWITKYFDDSLPVWNWETQTKNVTQTTNESRAERRSDNRRIFAMGLASVLLAVGLYAAWNFFGGIGSQSRLPNQFSSEEGGQTPSQPETLEEIDKQTWKIFAEKYHKDGIDEVTIRDAVISAYGVRVTSKKEIAKDILDSFGPVQNTKSQDGMFSAWMLLQETQAKEIKELFGLTVSKISPSVARDCQDRLIRIDDLIRLLGNRLGERYSVDAINCVKDERHLLATGEVVSGFNKLLEIAKSYSGQAQADRLPSPYFYDFDAKICGRLKGIATELLAIDNQRFQGESGPPTTPDSWPAIIRRTGDSKVLEELLHACLYHLTSLDKSSSISELQKFIEALGKEMGEIEKARAEDH